MSSTLTIPANNQPYSNKALPRVVEIDSGINEKAVNFREKLGFLPKSISKKSTELFFVGSFVSAVFLALRASLMELMPKALVGGIIRAKSVDANNDGSNNPNNSQNQAQQSGSSSQSTLWNILSNLFTGKTKFNVPVAMDEVFLELSEYIATYFMPTLASVGLFSRMVSKSLGIDFEFFGKPLHLYEKNLGNTVELGTLERKRLLVNKETLSKLALGKSLIFAAVVSFCGSLEFMVPAIRDFLTKWFLGYDNFSKLLGFQNELEDEEYKNPMQHAAQNIQKGLLAMSATVAGVIGLSLLFRNRMGSPKIEDFFRKFSRHLDLGEGFQLSNTPLALILTLFAIPGYMTASRGRDEATEIRNRIILYSIPTIVAYKQTVLDVLTLLSGVFHGAGKDVLKLFPVMFQQIKDGERDPLDWNVLSGFSYDKKSAKFSGMIAEMPALKEMNPERQKSFLNSVKIINKMPLILAFAIGAVINFLNLQIIFKMHEDQEKKNKENSSSNKTNNAVLAPA
ncbi:MAG: hypothetical protein SFU25_04485 [Candidatus Caenarcaniphilales bacterium]|nr:hypothetical protein [Candidatus Caenarcaniphilales bacterium]